MDKTGCISFCAKKYEVGLKYMGFTVGVAYDPLDISEITIEYKDDEPFKVKELVIGTNTGKRPKLPETLKTVKPASSRLLAGAKKTNKKRRASQKMILSFRKMSENGGE